jgi:hypothetical protein
MSQVAFLWLSFEVEPLYVMALHHPRHPKSDRYSSNSKVFCYLSFRSNTFDALSSYLVIQVGVKRNAPLFP